MSASHWEILRTQISEGEYTQAEKSIDALSVDFTLNLPLYFSILRHAIHARQPALTGILTGKGIDGLDKVAGSLLYVHCLEEAELVLAACAREKMDEPARQWIEAIAGSLERQSDKNSYATVKAVASFAEKAGRYALRKKEIDWFADVAQQTTRWLSQSELREAQCLLMSVFESWMHRIQRHSLVDALPVFFDSALLFLQATRMKEAFWNQFLPIWRVAATISSLNPFHSMASDWVEQLLLLLIRSESGFAWRPVVRVIGEVSRVAVSKHDFSQAFPVFRPLLDIARVNLADEIKLGNGPDPESSRQENLRLFCGETLRIAEIAARNDVTAVAGDRIEEMFQAWIVDPDYEAQFRSIQRFCQLMLIYWTVHRRKSSRKWAPREPQLTEPVLSETDRQKLSFLL